MNLLARICLLAIPAAGAAAQSTLVVPTAFATIQAAIVAAIPGDTVSVLPGTYVERIDFLGKAITVRGSAGAAATTIDGNQAGTVVTFANGEPPAAVLEGFTITNGLGGVAPGFSRMRAGGIDCAGASPTIRRCVITQNTGGSGAVLGLTPGGDGGSGGLYVSSPAARVLECVIASNVGGVGRDTLVLGGVFFLAAGWGGDGGAKVVATGPSFELRDCVFRANQGGDGGNSQLGQLNGRGGAGALALQTTSPLTLRRCHFADNRGGHAGAWTGGVSGGQGGAGGFWLRGGVAVTLVGSTVVGNRGGDAAAGSPGLGGSGGGNADGVVLTAIATTIAGNVAGSGAFTFFVAGGLSLTGTSVAPGSLQNCIAWGNVCAGLASDVDASAFSLYVTACDIGAANVPVTGFGNLSVDPLFVNLAGGDVHLTAGSPCRHAGAALAGLPAFDLDGDPRTVGPAPDMGADEWDGLVGSREDLALSLLVNGAASPAVVTTAAFANDVVAVQVVPPAGTLVGVFAIVGVEGWLPPNAPVGPPALPELRLSGAAFALALVPGGVGVGGLTLAATIPPGLAGLALRVQAFALTPAARNGAFAATAARDVLLQ